MHPPRDREIELKLELNHGDAAQVLEHPAVRRAASGAPRVQQLRSVYFDSEDHALARAGIGLRLRRSGGEQVQTVKSGEEAAAGLFERGEVEVAVAGDTPDLDAIPDESLRGRILEALDGQPLVPVFETEMRRTSRLLRDGDDEWSLDLDEGSVRAGDANERFCELELELRHGEASRLYELALELAHSFDLRPGTRTKAERGYALRSRAHPAARKAAPVELPAHATLDTALREIARSCLAQIGGNAAAAWDGADPEGVHQMRVGVRRMRSVFSVFQPVLPADPTRVLREHLRWLAAELGSVRDLDVFIEELLVPLFAVRSDDPGLSRLRAEAERLREERRQALRKALDSRRQTRLVLELGHWISRSAWREQALSEQSALLFQPAAAFATGVLSRLQRKAEKLGQDAITGPPAARHQLRIALKKLRYACEFFRALFPKKDVKRYLKRLSALQDLLGALNDIVTASRVLEELLARVGPDTAPSLARAAGFIEGFAARQDEIALRELAAQWARFERTREFWEP
jgi:inorganic triphosphatase YgiF